MESLLVQRAALAKLQWRPDLLPSMRWGKVLPGQASQISLLHALLRAFVSLGKHLSASRDQRSTSHGYGNIWQRKTCDQPRAQGDTSYS